MSCDTNMHSWGMCSEPRTVPVLDVDEWRKQTWSLLQFVVSFLLILCDSYIIQCSRREASSRSPHWTQHMFWGSQASGNLLLRINVYSPVSGAPSGSGTVWGRLVSSTQLHPHYKLCRCSLVTAQHKLAIDADPVSTGRSLICIEQISMLSRTI